MTNRAPKITPEYVRELQGMVQEVSSLDFLKDFGVEIAGETKIDKALERRELERDVKRMLMTLTEKEEKVLRMRFGIDEDESTLEQVGLTMGVSRERARQVECEAIKKLQTHKRMKVLKAHK
jgi:RNA polymerase primary sigma factor